MIIVFIVYSSLTGYYCFDRIFWFDRELLFWQDFWFDRILSCWSELLVSVLTEYSGLTGNYCFDQIFLLDRIFWFDQVLLFWPDILVCPGILVSIFYNIGHFGKTEILYCISTILISIFFFCFQDFKQCLSICCFWSVSYCYNHVILLSIFSVKLSIPCLRNHMSDVPQVLHD